MHALMMLTYWRQFGAVADHQVRSAGTLVTNEYIARSNVRCNPLLITVTAMKSVFIH
jgi:hypothetical protein